MRNRVTAAVVLALAGASSGCWQPDVLPPAAAPTKQMPPVRADFGPLEPRKQWIVLDSPGEVAQVKRSVRSTDGEVIDTWRTVCAATPCVVDLKYGKQDMLFQSTVNTDRSSGVTIQLGDDPLIVRQALGEYHQRSVAGGAVVVLGVAAAIAGTIAAPVGFAKGDQTTEAAGLVTLGVGAVLVAIGLPVAYFQRGSIKPGATTWWTVPRGGTTPSSVEPQPP